MVAAEVRPRYDRDKLAPFPPGHAGSRSRGRLARHMPNTLIKR
jgi:hypothetical protein